MPGFSDDCLSLGYTRTSCESHPLQDVTNYLVLSSAEPFTWASSVSSCDSRYFSPQGCVFLCVSHACHIHWVYCVRIYMQLSWLLREDVLVISLIKNTVACSVMGSKRVLNDSHIHIHIYLVLLRLPWYTPCYFLVIFFIVRPEHFSRTLWLFPIIIVNEDCGCQALKKK